METDPDATRSQAPAVNDATRSGPPGLVTRRSFATGETFDDEPERYAIEGQIGAGGMGTVLAAKGSRLGRPVALKVVTADRDDLRRRFEREAQVTARLQHPAIVPVYGAGRRDGQPFYAMKHVTGEPLDKVIAKTETLNDRVALLPKVITVTEAIAYAHAEKVIHRDLKPANILVGAFGETVVIDWGLAKDLGKGDDEVDTVSPYRASGEETAHGKVMGTPAYMPLEQARGEVVDERADVYALGAILYHVLAGRAPYKKAGEDGVAWESMLARVISAPPEPLGEEVPPDLRAIVSRAMAREPDRRYPTAGELAEDLRRFQTGQLVGAHRYSTWQLVRRWIKRNRAPVAVATIAFAVLVIGGIVSMTRIVREQERTETERAAAVASRGQAEDLMGFMLVDLRDKLRPLGKLDLLKTVADKAVAYYDARTEELDDHEAGKRALAMVNIGDVLVAQGDSAKALNEFRAALAIRVRLAAKDPADGALRVDLATSHERVGDILYAQGDLAGASREYRVGLELREPLVHAGGNAIQRKYNLATSHGKLGNVLLDGGDNTAALNEYRRARDLMQEVAAADPKEPAWLDEISVADDKIGDVLHAQGDLAGATRSFREERDLVQTLITLQPQVIQHQRDLFVSQLKLAEIMQLQGSYPEALEMFRAGKQTMERVASSDPSNAGWQHDLASATIRVGDGFADVGKLDGASTEYREARAILERQAAADPRNVTWQSDLAAADGKLGHIFGLRGDIQLALDAYVASAAILRALAEKDPKDTSVQRDLAEMEHEVGKRFVDKLDPTNALKHFETASSLAHALVLQDPTNARWQNDLGVYAESIGSVAVARGDLDTGLARYREYLEIMEKLVAADNSNATWSLDLANAHSDVGDVLLQRHDAGAAIKEYLVALAICEPLVDKAKTHLEYLGSLADVREHLAEALRASGERERSKVELGEALSAYQTLANAAPENPTWRKSIARARAAQAAAAN